VQAVGCFSDRQAVVAVEAAEQRDREPQQPGGSRAERGRGEDGGDDGQHEQNGDRELQREAGAADQDRGEQASGGYGEERPFRRGWCGLGHPAAERQQALPQRVGLVARQVGEPARLAAAARQPDPQLGEPEDAREAGTDDVDRLDLAQREALGGSPDQAALDPQHAAFHTPSGHQPGDHREHHHDHE
jgi:hypothetical protein